jgi:hypothetical protein
MDARADTWLDPWSWPEYRRMHRGQRLATTLLLTAIIMIVPAAWILMMPTDPLLRPEITTTWAWAALCVCVVFAAASQSIARRARARFDFAIYKLTQKTREIAAARNIALEIDLGESFPPVLLGRQQRIIAIVGPSPLFIPMEHVRINVKRGSSEDELRQPHIVLQSDDVIPEHVIIAPARGVINLEQTNVLAERLRDLLETALQPDQAPKPIVDVAAFIDSMRSGS